MSEDSCGGDHSETVSTQLSCLRSKLFEVARDKGDLSEIVDPSTLRLVNSAVWFSKYLLLSSSSRSVSNLQGLWADGPESAWNGDHHTNINQQMNYWPVHGLGVQRTVMPPFLQLIRDLAQEGQTTATSLYGCKGWVAHGFTDNLLNGGMRAGLMWSLCVTCK